MNIKDLLSRNDLYEEILKTIICFKSSTYIFAGPSGSGKKYTLGKLYSNLITRENISVLEFIDDQIICKNDKYKDKQQKISFEASFYVGITISSEEKNTSKLNYIISTLKEIKNTNIVLFQPNIENSNDSIKQILKIIVNNKEFIEKSTGKLISVFCSVDLIDKEYLENWNFVNEINFEKYNQNDMEEYIKTILNYDIYKISNYQEKLKIIFDISNGNLNIVNIVYKDVFEKSIEYCDSLIKIIESRIKETEKEYSNDIVSERDLEDIILCSSLCMHYFNKKQIAYITKKTDVKTIEGLNIYYNSNFFQKSYNTFYFVSEEIRQILEAKKKASSNELYIELYNYASLFKHDDYYERAYYLMKYYNDITPEVLSLFILAISKSFTFDDSWRITRIKDYVIDFSKNRYFPSIIQIFINAHRFMLKNDYSAVIEELNKININYCNTLTLLEIKRLKFKAYYYSNKTGELECYNLVEGLREYSKNMVKLHHNDSDILCCDEYTERLQIIFDIAPCIIDNYNDVDDFEELYDTSVKICKYIEENNLSSFTTEYILSIFNRKAFLFSNPMTSNIYYDQAKQFFYQNNIFDEYCITLICYAGTMLACANYQDAITYCEEAYSIIKSKNISIPTPEKLDNNCLIARFLIAEEEGNNEKIQKISQNIAANLSRKSKKLDSSASKHVMLTNAASLFLYSGKYSKYKEVKKEIEESMNCEDVSNIIDGSINDFYRYHFAWFEIFYNMQHGNWDICEHLISELDGFIPALFKKNESILKRKNKSVKELIAQHKKVDSYYFCNNLVNILNKKDKYNAFFYRGLPVSDLQYTSYN